MVYFLGYLFKKVMKFLLQTLFVGVFCFDLLLAQNPKIEGSSHSEDLTLFCDKAKEGTFQLIRTSKIDEALNSEALVQIEKQRDEEEIIYYRMSDNLTVMILPYEEINKSDFRPIKFLYVEDEIKEGGQID